MLTQTVYSPLPLSTSPSLSSLDSNSCTKLLIRDKRQSGAIYSRADREGERRHQYGSLMMAHPFSWSPPKQKGMCEGRRSDLNRIITLCIG